MTRFWSPHVFQPASSAELLREQRIRLKDWRIAARVDEVAVREVRRSIEQRVRVEARVLGRVVGCFVLFWFLGFGWFLFKSPTVEQSTTRLL